MTRVVRIIARLNVGGVARHVAWLSAGLRNEGFDTLLVTGTLSPGEDDMADFATAQGVTPLVIPDMGREVSVRDLVTTWKLYRLFVRVRPAVVHTHTAKAGTVGRLAGLLYRWTTPGSLVGRPRPLKVVHTYHGHIFHSYYGPLKTRLFLAVEKLLAWLATDRIVVLSPRLYDEIHRTFGVGRPEQFVTIPLGLDLGEFAGWSGRRQIVRTELGAGDADILVGIVGRLTEIKNHTLFFQSAARFQELHGRAGSPRVAFVVIGDGHLREQLEEQARRLGLEKQVTFLGMRNDPHNFYPALDVVALTSLNEGTPLTLLEAMANERAVIATRVGGVGDLLGEPLEPPQLGRGLESTPQPGYTVCQRGVAVRSNDAVGFCRGLARLVEDPNLRRDLGERGRRYIEQHHSGERLLGDIANLYRTMNDER